MLSVCLNKCRNFITHKWNLTRRGVKPWCICQRECMIWLHNWDLVVIRKRNWNLSAFSLCALLLLQWKLTFDKELSPSSDKWTTEMLSLVRWDASKQFFYYFSFYNFYCSLRCSVSDQVFGFFFVKCLFTTSVILKKKGKKPKPKQAKSMLEAESCSSI